MIIYDYIFLILIILSIALGYLFGFGKVIKRLTKGVVGVIISVIICYFLFGLFLKIGIINNLLTSFRTSLSENGSVICRILLTIRIDLIVYAIVLFIFAQLVRILIVSLLDKCFSAENTAMRIINKTAGVILSLAVTLVLVFLLMQIYSLIGGKNSVIFAGSFFKLDYLYLNNPLNAIF